MRSAIVAAALLIVACSGENGQAGAATAEDAQQLNEAAAMLDANSVEPGNVAPDNGGDIAVNQRTSP